ncbi:hypothetical protein D7V93_01500 [Corallococcus llansteffanensis]|uniref:Uncharacterized protein n=1 Tax=Corallococcus llansteffanensis TaxID=2316731 RepID=A0A3A8QKC3_9BACT|nr:hypothetical protein D7V93_01500 [Corallococcus llansteffanensis]
MRYDGKSVPAGPTLPVDGLGPTLTLDVPPGVELLRAELCLQMPGDDVTLDLMKGVPPAAVATSAGRTCLPTDGEIRWLTVDWGVRRPLTFLQIDSPTANRRGRLKVSDGGPWFPPLPMDVIPLGREGQQLPALMASRLMLELVEDAGAGSGNPLKESSASVQGVLLKAAARPADLWACIGTQSPFFQYPQPLPPRQELILRDELSIALRQAWPAGLQGGPVEVHLRSSAAGRLRRARLSLETAVVVTTWKNGSGQWSGSLPYGGEVVSPIDVPTDRPLRSVELTVEAQSRKERVPLTPAPPSLPEQAQLCGPGFVAAQAFTVRRKEALLGIDLHLRLLSRAARGTVTLHSDVGNRPAEVSLNSTTVEFELESEGDPPWGARWLPVDLPSPVTVEGTWWVVLTLTEGQVLWTLDAPPAPPPSAAAAPLGALYQLEKGPWLEREPPPLQAPPLKPWACCRPRFFEPATPPPPSVLLRWGTHVLPVVPDARGRVSLDERTLGGLPGPQAGTPLEVVVRSQVAGELTLSALRVTSPRSDTYELFTPS